MGAAPVAAQRYAVKTNVLYDANCVPNLGAEIRIDTTKTLEVTCDYNPFTVSSARKWKTFSVQPEFRFWTSTSFSGFFYGGYAQYGIFNVCELPGNFLGVGEKRYEGSAVGGGLSCGYHWILSPHWGLEASLSAGYLYLSFDQYHSNDSGYKEQHGSRSYVGPTRLNLSLVYVIK